MTQEPRYCDHCGLEIEDGAFIPFSRLPYNADSANEGESGIVCLHCHEKFRPRKLRLVIEVEYNPGGLDIAELKDLLADLAIRASGFGGFTGDTPATVDTWTAWVEEIVLDDGEHCPGCGKHHSQEDVDGGRCTSCGTMLCAIMPGETRWGPDRSHAPDCAYRCSGECDCPKSETVEEEE
jgi:hypothetical protein